MMNMRSLRCWAMPLRHFAFSPARVPKPALRSQQRAMAALSVASNDTAARGPVYTAWSVYKKSAALQVKVIRPSWKGDAKGGLALEREGVALLELASGSGNRQFDWNNKLTFALSAMEMCRIARVIVAASGESVDLYHDPNMQTNTQGQTTKRFRMGPDQRGSGHLLTVTVTDKASGSGPTSITIPLSDDEITCFQLLAQFLVPRLLGFDEIFRMPAVAP